MYQDLGVTEDLNGYHKEITELQGRMDSSLPSFKGQGREDKQGPECIGP